MAVDGDVALVEKLQRKIEELGENLSVNKEKRIDETCIRDEETGALICVRKRYLKDMVHQVSGFAVVGDKPIITKGNPRDVQELMRTYKG